MKNLFLILILGLFSTACSKDISTLSGEQTTTIPSTDSIVNPDDSSAFRIQCKPPANAIVGTTDWTHIVDFSWDKMQLTLNTTTFNPNLSPQNSSRVYSNIDLNSAYPHGHIELDFSEGMNTNLNKPFMTRVVVGFYYGVLFVVQRSIVDAEKINIWKSGNYTEANLPYQQSEPHCLYKEEELGITY